MSASPILTSPCKNCPTCGRKFQAPRHSNKKLTEDVAKASAAIVVLRRWFSDSSLGEACQLEAERLRRALTDHSVLWAIYRRHDKATGYGISLVKAVS